MPDEAPAMTLRFDVDAALLLELGERLVARHSVALAELIKNAYDADATEAVIQFSRVTTPRGIITIRDNGVGMSRESVERHWMRIATQHKTVATHSPHYRRPTAGAKGVGRFAARRLADSLTLDTTAEVSGGCWERTIAHFDWTAFVGGTNLRDLSVPAKVNRYATRRPTGTTLVLGQLKDVWSRESFYELRDELLDLTPPPSFGVCAPLDGDPGFSIMFRAPEFKVEEEVLSDTFWQAALSRLTAHVDDEGRPHYVLSVRGNDKQYTFSPSGKRFSFLAGARAIVHHFVYRSQYFQESGLSLTKARSFGRRFGGVRIYLDGFRVFPYGDMGDDWLSLDQDRAGRLYVVPPVLAGYMPTGSDRPLLNLPGNNQVFGWVFLSRLRHPEIAPTLTRERLFVNDAFIELKGFVRLGVDWQTLMRHRLELQERGSAPSGQPSQPLVRSMDSLRAEVRSLPVHHQAKLVAAVDALENALRETQEERIGQLQMLRVLASAGTMVVVFSHEVRALVDGFRDLLNQLERLRSSDPAIALAFETLRRLTEAVEAQANQIGLLISVEARRRRRRLALRPLVDTALAALTHYCSKFGVEVRNEVPADLRTPPIYEAEAQSIILNLLTNALRAVKTQPTRVVAFFGSLRKGGGVSLRVADTGHGISPQDRELVFQPFYTTSEPDPVLGVGTGLGLTIVRDIVHEHGGTVLFREAEKPWATCIEVELPDGVGDRSA